MRGILCVMLTAALLCGCDEMSHQPKYGAYAPSKLFRDGKAMQSPPEGVIARDDPAAGSQIARPAMDLALLHRGQNRYEIFCVPCHDEAGYGDGTVPNRGFPHPPNFHDPNLRSMSPDFIVDVISFGRGDMYPFADRIAPRDRWAIAAYIIALQDSQDSAVDELTPMERARLSDGAHEK